MKRKTIILFTASIFSIFLTGCKKEQPKTEETVPVTVEKSSHNWYYFTNNSFSKIDKPQNAPQRQLLPWTETVRISSTGTGQESFGIVNRLGVLCFDNENIYLAADNNIFQDRTAGNLVFSNGSPIYSVYKSSFFNDTITAPDYKDDKSSHLFLIQFDPVAKISYPLVNSGAISDEENSEVTDFVWDNNTWICAVKSLKDNKNDFSYVSWTPDVPLLSLSPAKAKENISIKEVTADVFRNAKSQLDFSQAPERIKNLLAGFSKDSNFTIEVKTANGPSPRNYINKTENTESKELVGKGIIAPSWSAVLFEDGTLFLEGALSGRHILRNGKPVAIRLPKLPAGFLYSDFTISGTTLYAAWEESNFYKTGRSGFIQVNLDNTLYSKML